MAIAGLDALIAAGFLPGLIKSESAVGKAWLVKHADDFDRVQFNFRVGSGVELPPGTPDYVVASAFASTTKRLDIVAHERGNVALVEVKDRIGLSALGQLLGYSHLYQQDNPATGHIALIVAGRTIQADIAPIFASAGVSVELFPSVTF